ncbi:Bug family tripartite tricarboxylate transporter substrate binding protein [Bordetella genomosp. 13]|uniref:ABC transporter substrate-binding protein n=1 Tax=Bordetella genomosp. 13 TaxID=463040 RepID=A0A1W6ZHT0_9BORD|nr:tripartite tricarboxylate transporter substrate binding protein [Bordetella genomosp. 13]ARP96837.1 hypothetical protein CAL15_22205 [Bordetella genomosp. 13]
MNRRTVLKTLGFAATLPLTSVARASEAYASRPIRLVVPYPPGGVTDVAARLAGEVLTARYGQPVVVENRPGASGLIGQQVVASSAPDGYTLIMGGLGGNVLPPVTVKGLPLDVPKAFVPIAQIAEFINVLVVSKDSPVTNVQEFVALAKSKGAGAMSYGSNGIGTSAHLTTEFFAQRTGLKMEHVPYKGSGELNIDVANGNLDFSINNLPAVLPLVKKGSLKAIAVTSTYRSKQLPDTPTFQESGIADFDVTSWLGVYAPAALPPALAQELGDVIAKGMSAPEMRKRLETAGFEPQPRGAKEFAALNQRELERWGEIARRANVVIPFGKG